MPEQPKTTIFFAWQSDLNEKLNHFAIKQALIRAATKLAESALSQGRSYDFVVDESTSGLAGSPHIPTSILEKIQAADFFVADVSAINANQNDVKKTPNPNVVFELGYAAASLGWQRILMLINASCGGTPEDLPFDFDRHRAATYTLAEGEGSQEALNQLVLKALTLLVQTDAPRPTANIFNEATAQRERDLANLRWLLRAVHLPTLDDHVTSSAKRVSAASAHFSEVLVHITESSQFHLYDAELRTAVQLFVEKWAGSTDANDYFSDHPNPHYFLFIASHGSKRLAELEELRDELRSKRDHLLQIIRERFQEIDLQATSRDAGLRYDQELASENVS
jgi:hypothetical protein